MDDPLWPRVANWILGPATGSPTVTVVGVPSSIASITPSNARNAPASLRMALAGFSPFDGERRVDLTSIGIEDGGDIPLDDDSMVASQEQIRTHARGLDTDAIHVFVGGDNAITRPLVTGLFDDLGTVGVITLDAHHDVRVLDDGPRNGTPIRGLIDDGLPGANVVQIGIHSFANSSAYRAYCDEHGISVLTMTEVEAAGPDGVAGMALERLAHVDHLYVDVDVDVLDRAFAPGCPGARPGGMTPRQLGAIAAALGRDPRVVAVDLVEVDPDRDHDGITIEAMAHTLLSFLSGVAARQAP